MYRSAAIWPLQDFFKLFLKFISPPCSIYSNGDHVCWTMGTSDTIVKLNTLRIIMVRFGYN
jgi:hypothetical protein